MDSVVLLDALAREAGRPLSAVHVHHGLSPNADRWAKFCEGFCASRGVALSVERVKVPRGSGSGLEAAAREARYRIYAARPEPFVALAHHLDDQAETVLLQLLRGTGLKGVAGMPAMRTLPDSRVTLWRPLLAMPRALLHARARALALEWVDDESNALTTQDRNYLRHAIAPLLDARWPAWRNALARFARNASEADALLANKGSDPFFRGAEQANAIRQFLAAQGLAMPSAARLAEMVRQLHGARQDARVRIEHDGATLVRHRGEIHAHRMPADRGEWRIAWRGEKSVDLGHGRGEVRFKRAKGEGIDATLAREGDWCFMPRAGGEKMRVAVKGRTRTLKNLLQENAIPAWRRENL
ncbi:MAG TPA: tRNA lysidine(34) synthetase TilS, partial [Usitatibacter sp.]|nr:tRNA lysidine(34) synthetase TilS [Usitatibacter sp.]